MSQSNTAAAEDSASRPPGRWLEAAEDTVLGALLLTALLVPVVEAGLRALGRPGLPGAGSLVQHATLWIGMAGGAVAARQARLLGFGGVVAFLPAGAQRWAAVVTGGAAAAIALLLATAGWQLVMTERAAGVHLGFGLPTWVAQAALPAGFAMVALRLVWHAAPTWALRLLAAALAVGLVATGALIPVETFWSIRWAALGGVLVVALLGAPIFAVLGGVTLVLLFAQELPLATIPLKHYALTTNSMLPSLPLFTLAGYFLAEGGASRRLVRVFNAWFGGLRGGPAVVAVLACAFFTTFTGASGVTILALGGLLLPVLVGAGLRESHALGLLTSSGALGLLFPPCLPMILFAVIAGTVLAQMDPLAAAAGGVDLERMFLGGFLPGVLLVGITVAWGVWRSPPRAATVSRFDGREAWRAFWEAKWELALPVVALVALFGGFATPMEAAALTALYAGLVEWLVYRDLRGWGALRKVLTECGLLIGGVLLILGVATGFTHWLVMEEVPDQAVAWATGHLESKWVFLLLLNLFLLAVGCLMDVFTATVVVVPLILPIGLAFGIDPVHLGVIFLANLELGYLTPPVGMNLFLASYRFNRPLAEILRAISGIFWWRLGGVLLVTYLPWLSTWLPSLRD